MTVNSPAWITKSILAALLLVLNTLFFSTFIIYSNNSGEFLVPYREVLLALLLPMLGCLVVLLAVGAILPKKARNRYLLLLMFLGIAAYFHANILVWDMGVLDGNQLDFSKSWRGWVDAALWFGALWLTLRFRQWLLDNSIAICSILILMQFMAVAVQASNRPESVGVESFQKLPQSLREFSGQGDVLHIVLDAFQSNIFAELLTEDDDWYERLAGFTFFPDAITSSEVTYLSLPAFVSGQNFRNEQRISDYWKQTLEGENLYSVLAEENYDVEIATPVWWNARRDYQKVHYSIPKPYVRSRQVVRTASAAWLIDLSLFRSAPYFLKSYVYSSQSWLFSRFTSEPELRYEHFSHNAFMRDLASDIDGVSRARVYKFIHLITPHAPIVATKDCESSGSVLEYNKDNFKQQSLCTLSTVYDFLRRLQQEGLYDSSLILIHSDHGGGVPFDLVQSDDLTVNSLDSVGISGSALPLVLVKPPRANGPLQVSSALVELSDIPATIAQLLGLESHFTGLSMFKLDREAKAERTFYLGDIHRNDAAAKDFFDNYTSFVVKGSVFLESSWHKGPSIESKLLSERSVYNWGDLITFGSDGSSKAHQVEGWSVTSAEDITWNASRVVELSLEMPKATADVIMEVDGKTFLVPGVLDMQRVQVFIGSNMVGQWQVTNLDFHTMQMVLPKGYFDGGKSVEIRFGYPDAQSPKSIGVGRDTRPLGMAFRSLRFTQTSVD